MSCESATCGVVLTVVLFKKIHQIINQNEKFSIGTWHSFLVHCHFVFLLNTTFIFILDNEKVKENTVLQHRFYIVYCITKSCHMSKLLIV